MMNLFFTAMVLTATLSFFYSGSSSHAFVVSGTALIISALIAATATVGAGVATNIGKGKAEKKSLDLAMLARDDQQNTQDRAEALTQQSLDLKAEQSDYNKVMQREVTNKNQIKMLGDSIGSMSKSGMNMQNFLLSLYGGSSPRR